MMAQQDERKEHALFLLMAQLQLATSNLNKWRSTITFDQVGIAYRHYKEFYDRDKMQHEKATDTERPA